MKVIAWAIGDKVKIEIANNGGDIRISRLENKDSILLTKSEFEELKKLVIQ